MHFDACWLSCLFGCRYKCSLINTFELLTADAVFSPRLKQSPDSSTRSTVVEGSRMYWQRAGIA